MTTLTITFDETKNIFPDASVSGIVKTLTFGLSTAWLPPGQYQVSSADGSATEATVIPASEITPPAPAA